MEPEIKKRFGSNKILNIFFIVAFSIIFLYYVLSAPVWNRSVVNEQGVMIHVASGETLNDIANELKSKHVIRQPTALKFFVYLFRAGHQVPRGDYLFSGSMPVWRVSWMLARGKHGINPTRITIKEGATNDDIALLLADKLQVFRKDLFLSDPNSKEGYLFPDTYFFFPLTTSDEITLQLSANFNRHINPLMPDILKSGHSLDDIITMASLVEKEAENQSDAPIIAGILWKRIANNMPLQVDADKSTYTTLGLPIKPIGNPGMVAIKAAIYPTSSPYLYYLHDKTGTVHFAINFAEHKTNIAKYLK